MVISLGLIPGHFLQTNVLVFITGQPPHTQLENSAISMDLDGFVKGPLHFSCLGLYVLFPQ